MHPSLRRRVNFSGKRWVTDDNGAQLQATAACYLMLLRQTELVAHVNSTRLCSEIGRNALPPMKCG